MLLKLCDGLQEKTALHFAAENGHAEAVRALLSKGANVNAEYVSKVGSELNSDHDKHSSYAMIKIVASIQIEAKIQAFHSIHSSRYPQTSS
jgi:ankyrin repeat protein